MLSRIVCRGVCWRSMWLSGSFTEVQQRRLQFSRWMGGPPGKIGRCTFPSTADGRYGKHTRLVRISRRSTDVVLLVIRWVGRGGECVGDKLYTKECECHRLSRNLLNTVSAILRFTREKADSGRTKPVEHC